MAINMSYCTPIAPGNRQTTRKDKTNTIKKCILNKTEIYLAYFVNWYSEWQMNSNSQSQEKLYLQ